MNCEIVDKETGDRVNWAAGCLCWLCVIGLLACACIRGCQEIKKHARKDKVPAAVQTERLAPHQCR